MLSENTPIYIINLDKAKDRWKKWETVDLGMNHVHRFSAVVGKNIPDDQLRNEVTSLTYLKIRDQSKRSFEDMDSLAAVGVSYSHYSLWSRFLDEYPNEEYCIVFEDDAFVEKYDQKKFVNTLMVEYNNLPSKEWDMWILGSVYIRNAVPWGQEQERTISSLRFPVQYVPKTSYMKVYSFWGSHAYVISRECIRKLQQKFFPIETHMDVFFGLQAQLGNITTIFSKSLNIGQPVIGEIQHSFTSIAAMNQDDLYYKLVCILLLLILIIIFIVYFARGCNGKVNVFTFLGDSSTCTLKK